MMIMQMKNNEKNNKCFLDQWVDELATSIAGLDKDIQTKHFHKLLSAGLVLLIAFGVGTTPAATYAFYNDTEVSSENRFKADILDFDLSWGDWDDADTAADLEEGESVSRVLSITPDVDQQLGFSYDLLAQNLVGAGCADLAVSVSDDSGQIYNGLLSALAVTGVIFGDDTDELTFAYSVSDTASNFGQCNFDVLVQGYMPDFSYGVAFYDQEGISDTITTAEALGVVLNEVLADPGDINFGPPGEWVELFNNGDTAIDVHGWQLSEISGSTERFYTITGTQTGSDMVRTYSGSTLIFPNSWLVVLMGTNRLNNDGDTVSLYDAGTNLQDSYTYQQAKEGMSDARIPDGVGPWIDPIPSPGLGNTVDPLSEEFTDRFGSMVDQYGLQGPVSIEGGDEGSSDQEEDGEGEEEQMDTEEENSDQSEDPKPTGDEDAKGETPEDPAGDEGQDEEDEASDDGEDTTPPAEEEEVKTEGDEEGSEEEEPNADLETPEEETPAEDEEPKEEIPDEVEDEPTEPEGEDSPTEEATTEEAQENTESEPEEEVTPAQGEGDTEDLPAETSETE